MIEKYFLNGESLPTIPVPHDCVIKHIRLKEQCIEFVFEIVPAHSCGFSRE